MVTMIELLFLFLPYETHLLAQQPIWAKYRLQCISSCEYLHILGNILQIQHICNTESTLIREMIGLYSQMYSSDLFFSHYYPAYLFQMLKMSAFRALMSMKLSLVVVCQENFFELKGKERLVCR